MKTSMAVALVFVISCSSDDDSAERSTPSTWRSPACLKMQDAACDYLSDRCKEVSRADCDDTFQSFFCKSDAAANACTTALQSASCGGLPAACNGIADLARAQELCRTLISAVCDAVAACGKVSKSDCVNEVSADLDCSRAAGIDPDFDACLVQLTSADCTVDGAIDLPSRCHAVVKLLSGGVSSAPPRTSWQSVVANASAVWR